VTGRERMLQRTATHWQLRSRSLPLGVRTLVMGVVNVTPDSFSDGGLYLDSGRAIEHALQLLDEGADVLDLGAESTRPGSHAGDPDAAAVSAGEEQARLLPVLEGVLKARPEAILSVDTYKAATARGAIAAGAEIVNDVSGFRWDAEMPAACAEMGCGVVLMHTRGTPEEWRTQTRLASDDLLSLVREGLAASLEAARDAGISADSIVLDPGYGFGKRLDANYDLLARQVELLELGRPLLAGLSRKSFLTRTLAQSGKLGASLDDARLFGEAIETAGVAALVAAILAGASIVRVHAVRAAVEAAAIADAVLAAG
jgi:dihydropteroate synthase